MNTYTWAVKRSRIVTKFSSVEAAFAFWLVWHGSVLLTWIDDHWKQVLS